MLVSDCECKCIDAFLLFLCVSVIRIKNIKMSAICFFRGKKKILACCCCMPYCLALWKRTMYVEKVKIGSLKNEKFGRGKVIRDKGWDIEREER